MHRTLPLLWCFVYLTVFDNLTFPKFSNIVIELFQTPPLSVFINTPPSHTLLAEVNKLLSKDAVEQVPLNDRCRRFYSRHFTIPQSDGEVWPHLWITSLHAKKILMVLFTRILPLLKCGDWLAILSLQDTYFHITILFTHLEYLQPWGSSPKQWWW